MRYELNGSWYTPNELAAMSGQKPHTIRDRLRRGYSVAQAIQPIPLHDSIREFSEASYWQDWIGLSISDLYKIYWRWCVSHDYSPVQKQGFSRQIFSIYPNLKCVPTKHAGLCFRIIRERG